MQVQHNMSAVTAAAQQGIHASNFQKSAQKLSSGYRINTAADDAAQLSISEKMRAQIRGLNKAVNNAEEGANYIQTADGAMNEIHSMIHRMRELAIQSLNDTNTQQDRDALAMEMDKLQAEIDRIDTNTYFNTLPVFQEHEPSYYQIEGNRVWASNQYHSILAPDSSLDIHLPSGLYNPDTYTITVPDGIYTTQELIDEIDDAFADMRPENPGFVLEYTQDGRCCLNFEGENGQPAKIDSVDGGLAYLLYDCFNGLSSASLLGTTAFEAGWPLQITAGQNDELQFEIEPTDGSPSTPVSIKIPAGEYSRSEMIDLLNRELAAHPDVKATEYGDSCIQITGGYDNSITGLKGNMFKLELGSERVYTSVFYDNIRYGTSAGTSAYIQGGAYYHPTYTEKIKINQDNNELEFDYKGSTITITIPDGEYIIDDVTNTDPHNLTYFLNNKFQNMTPFTDISVTAPSIYDPMNLSGDGGYAYYKYLSMTSISTGHDIAIKFDTSDPRHVKTYDSLFKTTNYISDIPPSYQSGVKNMQITGSADLSGSITIPANANTLSLSVSGGTPFTITIPARTYNSLGDLVTELNTQLPADQAGVIQFADSNNRLVIQGLTDTVTDLDFGSTAGAYTQLFTGQSEAVNYEYKTGRGEEHYPQGATAPDIMNMASVTLANGIPQNSTTINSQNNSLGFYLNNSYISVTLADGTYSRSGLIDELNRQFTNKGYKVKASLSGNALTLTTTLTGNSKTLSLEVNTNYGSAWKSFVGTHPTTAGPDMPSVRPSYLQGANDFTSITLDQTNDNFVFKLKDGTECNVTLAHKTYTASQLASELQTAINTEIGRGKIQVVTSNTSGIRMESVTSDGYFEDPSAQNSSLYNAVFKKHITGTHNGSPVERQGSHGFDEAFIIGRYDITGSPIEIVSGMNDKFIIDLNYTSRPSDPALNYIKPLEVTIPPGTYTGTDIANLLTPALNAQLAANNITDFTLTATVGGHNTGVAGAIDASALQITLTEKVVTKPDGTKETVASAPGTYILEGVRGSAASSIFYKTSGKPEPSYVTGVQDIGSGVVLPPGKNTLTLKTDNTLHSYTFPDGPYTADELVAFLNDKFDTGDDNGLTAPLTASLEDGRLRITHKVIGSHTITEIGGSAKGIIFYRESSREGQDAFMLQVGALGHQGLELPRLRVGTAALKINSIAISRPKYAEKALQRLDTALNLLSERRSTYGALYNRIEHLNANNRNTSENVQASESRMRDANMAAEMVEYLKHKLLTDASDAVLAQANQLPNRLLNLLL